MEHFKKYMADAWNFTNSLVKNNKGAHLNICLGNVSGDMDSVIGSMIMGYYLTMKNYYSTDVSELTEEEKLAKFYIPVLNLTREELHARLDIIHHLKIGEIVPEELPSIKDIDLDHWISNKNLSVHLVDHNKQDCF